MSNINAIKIAEKAIVVSCRLWTQPCICVSITV